MKALRIAWLVAIILLVPLTGVGFFTHSRQQKEKDKFDKKIKAIEIKTSKLKEQDIRFEKLKKEGRIALKELNITKDNWWYLGELEGIKKKYKPLFRNISASKVKQQKNFTTYSRLVKMSSSFPEAVDLMDSLENTSGFQIEGLDIQSNNEDTSKHNVEFWMSFSRVRKKVVDKLSSSLTEKTLQKSDKEYYAKSLRLKPSWKKNQLLALKRVKKDPFIDLKRRRELWLDKLEAEREAKKIALEAKKAAGGAGIEGDASDANMSAKLVLKGILSIKGTKMAVLEAKYEIVTGRKNLYRYNVKVGDSVGNKEVVRIEEKRIVFKSGDMTYYSTMP